MRLHDNKFTNGYSPCRRSRRTMCRASPSLETAAAPCPHPRHCLHEEEEGRVSQCPRDAVMSYGRFFSKCQRNIKSKRLNAMYEKATIQYVNLLIPQYINNSNQLQHPLTRQMPSYNLGLTPSRKEIQSCIDS